MDFNTLLWGALVLFMVVCCGMMVRMMMKRSPGDKSERTVPHRDDESLISKPHKDEQ